MIEPRTILLLLGGPDLSPLLGTRVCVGKGEKLQVLVYEIQEPGKRIPYSRVVNRVEPCQH